MTPAIQRLKTALETHDSFGPVLDGSAVILECFDTFTNYELNVGDTGEHITLADLRAIVREYEDEQLQATCDAERD